MREITYARAICEALREEMSRDENVYIMGEDVGVYGGAFGATDGLLEEFGPRRVMDTPVSETAVVGAGVGSAMTGMRPVVELMFSDFSAVAFDQIINQAAKMRFMYGGKTSVPMVLRMASGSGTGAAAQHSQSLEALFCNIPGLKVVAPAMPADAKALLKAAIRDDNPVVFLEQKALYKTEGQIDDDEEDIPLGKADVKLEGADVSVITYGRCVEMALEAANEALTQGIRAEVLDLRTLSPLDTEAIIATAKKTRRVIIAHEAPGFAGFGGEIAAEIAGSSAFFSLMAPIRRVTGLFCPVPFAKNLEQTASPSAKSIADAMVEIVRS